MIGWLVRRLALMAMTFIVVTFLVFYLTQVATNSVPFGDTLLQRPEVLAYEITGYAAWLGDFLTWGRQVQSLATGRPAETMVLERLPATLYLFGVALVLQFAVALPLGILAAVRAGRRTDRIISVVAVATNSAPSFLAALFAIFVFADVLHWLPSSGMFTPTLKTVDPLDWLQHLILPAMVLANLGLGRLIRYTRTSLLESLGANYTVTARAKGLSQRNVTWRHALPNALLPLITVMGLQISALIGGSLLVEIVFGWPGSGQVVYQALTMSQMPDDPVILAYAAVVAIGALTGSFIADLAYVRADPRVNLFGSGTLGHWTDIAPPRPVLRLAALVLVATALAASNSLFTVADLAVPAPGPPVAGQPAPTPFPVGGGCIALADGTPCATPAPLPTFQAVRVYPSPGQSPSPAQRASALADVFRGFAFTAQTPGCAVAISDYGSTVYSAGFGSANLANGTPITPTTIFDVASVSKQFTAAAILLLVKDGRLALTDDVRRYVPELPAYGVPLTIRDLLYQTSGLPQLEDLVHFAGLRDTDSVTAAQMLRAVAAAPRLSPTPGGIALDYNNANYFLLGLIVARVSGESLGAFVEARIFRPLGMTASSFDDTPTTPIPGRATAYQTVLTSRSTSFAPFDLPWDMVGPGGLQTNVLDLLRWAGNFETGVVGGAAFLRQQITSGSFDDRSGVLYAAGLYLSSVDGHSLIWHDGGYATSGFRAALLVSADTGVAVALTCNSTVVDDPYSVALHVLEAWLGPDSAGS